MEIFLKDTIPGDEIIVALNGRLIYGKVLANKKSVKISYRMEEFPITRTWGTYIAKEFRLTPDNHNKTRYLDKYYKEKTVWLIKRYYNDNA